MENPDLKDMTPSVTIGPSLLVPTGISPYDRVSSVDITGRGFYRLDGNVLIAKTLHPWSASVSLRYGTYLERSVNREYGKYVEPYRKKLGDRSSASFSLSYIYYIGSGGDTLTGTGSYSDLREADATINGNRIETADSEGVVRCDPSPTQAPTMIGQSGVMEPCGQARRMGKELPHNRHLYHRGQLWVPLICVGCSCC